jgi:DNA gyrase subunit A
LRLFKGRSSKGIKGIQLNDKDKVISLSIIDNSKIDTKTINKDKKIKSGLDKFILSVSENGYGKRSSYLDYRVTNRGGKGIIGIINSPRNGNISSSLVVSENDEIILSTDKGSIMRCAVKEIRVAGRNTQGVRIKKLAGSEKVVSVIKIEDNIQ